MPFKKLENYLFFAKVSFKIVKFVAFSLTTLTFCNQKFRIPAPFSC